MQKKPIVFRKFVFRYSYRIYDHNHSSWSMEFPSHVPELHEKPFNPELLQAVFCHLTKARAFRILSFEKFSACIIINPLLRIPGFLNGSYNVQDKSLVPRDLLNGKKNCQNWLLSGLLNKASLRCLQWSMNHHEMFVLVIHCTVTKHITKCNQLQRQKYTHIYKTTFHFFSGIKSFLPTTLYSVLSQWSNTNNLVLGTLACVPSNHWYC